MRATRRKQVHLTHNGAVNRRARKLIRVRWPLFRAAYRKMLVDLTKSEDAEFWERRHRGFCARRGHCDCQPEAVT